MAISEDKICMQTIVDRKLQAKVEELAKRMGVSQSRMIYMLLDAAIEDNEWIIRMVTSQFARRMKSALSGKPSKSKSKSPKAATE